MSGRAWRSIELHEHNKTAYDSALAMLTQTGKAAGADVPRNIRFYTYADIFDVVMNIENHYSIDVIKEEMRVAMTYYRFFGEDKNIVNEQFQIVDEVRSCRELLEKLNETLIASWDLMYAKAKAYFDEPGHLRVPAKYSDNGIWLNKWVNEQKQAYWGNRKQQLTEEQVRRLDGIGMA